jgi:putative oxidoreductase
MRALLGTENSWAALILRVMLAIVILPHGAQKLLGWYGGNGFSGTMAFFTGQMQLPWLVAFLIIMGEFFGGLSLIIGFLTRFTAASLAIIMLGAIALVHWPHGFFMNWFGKQAGEGLEYHLLFIAICAALVIMGAGKWSVDRAIAHRMRP